MNVEVPSRQDEIESQLYVTNDFLDVIDELYPDEFEEAYQEYNRRFKGHLQG